MWTSKGGMQDLGTLGGPFSAANGIDGDGRVVGITATPAEVYAFEWTKASGIQDLGALVSPSGIGLSEALAIGAKGTIVGVGTTSSGAIHALLWKLRSAPQASR